MPYETASINIHILQYKNWVRRRSISV